MIDDLQDFTAACSCSAAARCRSTRWGPCWNGCSASTPRAAPSTTTCSRRAAARRVRHRAIVRPAAAAWRSPAHPRGRGAQSSGIRAKWASFGRVAVRRDFWRVFPAFGDLFFRLHGHAAGAATAARPLLPDRHAVFPALSVRRRCDGQSRALASRCSNRSSASTQGARARSAAHLPRRDDGLGWSALSLRSEGGRLGRTTSIADTIIPWRPNGSTGRRVGDHGDWSGGGAHPMKEGGCRMSYHQRVSPLRWLHSDPPYPAIGRRSGLSYPFD